MNHLNSSSFVLESFPSSVAVSVSKVCCAQTFTAQREQKKRKKVFIILLRVPGQSVESGVPGVQWFPHGVQGWEQLPVF